MALAEAPSLPAVVPRPGGRLCALRDPTDRICHRPAAVPGDAHPEFGHGPDHGAGPGPARQPHAAAGWRSELCLRRCTGQYALSGGCSSHGRGVSRSLLGHDVDHKSPGGGRAFIAPPVADAAALEGGLPWADHLGGESGAASLGHLPLQDVGHTGPLVMAMQRNAAAGGDGELPHPEFAAAQGGKIRPKRLAPQPLHGQHPLGHRDLLARMLMLMGWHHRRLVLAVGGNGAGEEGDHEEGPGDALNHSERVPHGWT